MCTYFALGVYDAMNCGRDGRHWLAAKNVTSDLDVTSSATTKEQNLNIFKDTKEVLFKLLIFQLIFYLFFLLNINIQLI